LLLIEGATNFGIGNWQDIADHVGSKSRDECEAHYLQVYVNSEKWPLPVSWDDLDGTESSLDLAQWF